MNRLQIRNMARKSLGETTASFWSDTELDGYINIAGHDIADKTKCIKTNSYITLVEDQSEYQMTLLTYPLSISEVYLYQGGTTWVKLLPTSRTVLDQENSGWISADSSVPMYYISDMESKLLVLYPAPNSTNSGTNYLRVFYSRDFTDLSLDSSVPEIAQDLQLAMVDFVTAYGFQQRGWGDKSNDAWSKYFTRLKEYMIERGRENEDYDVVMKPYRRS